MAAVDQARAQEQQETELPGITVEGGANKQPTVSPAPVAPPPQAQPQPTAAAPTPAADVPYETPAAVSVVGEGEIDTFGQTRIDSVLRTVPGTFTRESASNPGVAVNIRGLEGQGRVNMMIDGVRQNFRFSSHEATGFAYVDPQLLAGIDIQRGAVTTTGGAGALAGTANFRTIDVQDVLLPGKSEGVLSSLSWGSNGLGWSEMGAGAMRSGGVSIIGALSHHDESDYENGNGETVPYTSEDLWSGLVKLHFDIASDERLSFQAMRYNNDFVANSYDQTLTSDLYKASYSLRPADNPLVDFNLSTSINIVTMEYGSHYTGIAPSVADATARQIEDRGFGVNADNTSRFKLGAVDVTSNYGFEYYMDDVDTSNGGVNPTGKSDLSSGFTQTTFSYGIWDLIGGLRYQHFTLEGETTLYDLNPFGLPGGDYAFDEEESSWDPKVTLAARVLPWLQPYVTYSQSMRAPTVSETLMTGLHPITSPSFNMDLHFLPNPFLQPEEQKGWEFGFNVKQNSIFTRGDKFRLKADYYTQNVKDYITACEGPDGYNFITNTVIVTYYFCNNFGTTRLQGVELEGEYDAGYLFAHASYTYTHSDLPHQGDGLGAESYLPDHVASITGGLRFLDERLVVGMRGTFVSQTDIGGGNYEEAYSLADFFSSYQATENINVAVTVENLFNRAYTPAVGTIPTGDMGVDTGRGRTFLLTTRAQF